MIKKTKFNCNMKFEEDVAILNNNFKKVRIRMMHNESNKNGSFFDLEDILRAKDTLSNIPILGYIESKDDGNEDFKGHEVDYEISVDEKNELVLNTIYKEIPIGVIPQDNNFELVEDDGRTYIEVDGIIWESYSNSGWKIIEESDSKKVSMEISVQNGFMDENDGLYHITDFQFEGVTILGDDLETGMYDTYLTKFTNNSDKYKEYIKAFNLAFNKLETKGKEDDVQLGNENKEVKENFETNTDVKETKEVFENGEVQEKDTKVEFGLSIENLRQSINSQLQDITTTRTDYWGDTYECRCYWLETILPEEKIVILEDYNDWNKHYGVKYSMDGDNVVLDFESKAEYIQEWRVKQGTEEVITFEKEDPLKDIILEKFAKKEVEIENLQKEITKLEEIKLNYEKEVELEKLTNEIEEVISKFSFAEEEILDLKNKALNSEIDIETFEEKLFALEGRKSFAKKTKFSKEEDKKVKIGVKSLEKEETDETIVALNELKAKFCLMK